MLINPLAANTICFEGQCVAGVHHAGNPLGELGVIHGIMSSGDEGGIVLAHCLRCPWDGLPLSEVAVLAAGANDGHVGVVIIDGGTQSLEFFHEHIAGGFAVVFHVGFVGEADDQHATAV